MIPTLLKFDKESRSTYHRGILMLTAFLVCGLFSVAAQTLGPFQASSNFAFDLQGHLDTRPYTYGFADDQSKTIHFNPPAGWRVRILTLQGDFIYSPEFNVAPAAAGTGTYVMLALNRDSAESSGRCTPCDDNSMVTLQATWPGPGRIAFNRDVHVNGLLGPDNTLVIKTAIFFNTTGLFIHLEPTINFTYQFERD